jgi:hypothetical protein
MCIEGRWITSVRNRARRATWFCQCGG